jgi:hypothetical protein
MLANQSPMFEPKQEKRLKRGATEEIPRPKPKFGRGTTQEPKSKNLRLILNDHQSRKKI